MNTSTEPERCLKCSKRTYPLDRIVPKENIVFHKACFLCEHCNKVLSIRTYAALDGKYYCKPHFTQLFKLKGNYNEGFGTEKHTKKWLGRKGEPKKTESPPARHSEAKEQPPQPKAKGCSAADPKRRTKATEAQASVLRHRKPTAADPRKKQKGVQASSQVGSKAPVPTGMVARLVRNAEQKTAPKGKEGKQQKEPIRATANKEPRNKVPEKTTPPETKGNSEVNKKTKKVWLAEPKKTIKRGSIAAILARSNFHLYVALGLCVIYFVLLYNGLVSLPRWLRS